MSKEICPRCGVRPNPPGQGYCVPCKVDYNYERLRRKDISYSREPEEQRKYRQEYRRKFPEKHRAQVKTLRAVKLGYLERPSSCEQCGVTPPPRRDGCSGIQAHHLDYLNHMDVQWLCARCHQKIHKAVK